MNLVRFIVDLADADRIQTARVGGKCARLGEISRLEGVVVPDGVCVTTDAFAESVWGLPGIDGQLDRLSALDADDRDAIGALSAEVRRAIENVVIPGDAEAALASALDRFGPGTPFAVRSSATAEDSPSASFAGQHDTALYVVGLDAVLRHVKRCWASLFSSPAVTYRLRAGADHRTAQMAVLVQQMVSPEAAGVLFTADPVTSNRTVTSIEAVFGLGEGLVAGIVNPDVYTVIGSQLVARTIATKARAVVPSPKGGTREVAVEPERRRHAAISDAHALLLASLGRRIEAHFACPQDIEWCLVEDELRVVQGRPITTLFPVPKVDDLEHHVYLSVGHQQMMTDAMKPLGLSMWQLLALRPMHQAGGRLFVDVTNELASPVNRTALLDAWERGDPLTGSALRGVAERVELLPPATAAGSVRAMDTEAARPPAAVAAAPALLETGTDVVAKLVERCRASVDRLQREVRTKSGAALLDFIRADVADLQHTLRDPTSVAVIQAGMEARSWLNEHLEAWLGERNASDRLTLSAPDNVTSEMGLALLDVADAIRPHPDVVAFLRGVDAGTFLEVLPGLDGGSEVRDAMARFLAVYGMRCVGEIDITRPRWSENPTALLPMILSNVEHFEPAAGRRRFERGRQEARDAKRDLLARLAAVPGGEGKARQAEAMIDRLRMFAGYREYPKYHIVSRLFVYKTALLREADRLVERRALGAREDIFFLELGELSDLLRTGRVSEQLIRERKEAYRWHRTLTTPRVLTSDGEVVTGSYTRQDAPQGSLVGLPVSAGTAEGKARVVSDVAGADLDPGDILVTVYTDPSWTPLFVGISGLVTEIGGVMTHGSVIAREYGVAAVVGVRDATRLIGDGQRIRVHGLEGYVEILA